MPAAHFDSAGPARLSAAGSRRLDDAYFLLEQLTPLAVEVFDLARERCGGRVTIPSVDFTVPPKNAAALRAAQTKVQNSLMTATGSARSQTWIDARESARNAGLEELVLAAYEMAMAWRALLCDAAATAEGRRAARGAGEQFHRARDRFEAVIPAAAPRPTGSLRTCSFT